MRWCKARGSPARNCGANFAPFIHYLGGKRILGCYYLASAKQASSAGGFIPTLGTVRLAPD
jgi:hypothetical protein